MIKKTNELDQKLSKRQKTKLKMKSQGSVSLQANEGLYLHHFIIFISTREREGDQRGDKIYYKQYFPGKSSSRPELNEEH